MSRYANRIRTEAGTVTYDREAETWELYGEVEGHMSRRLADVLLDLIREATDVEDETP